jgi:hypothetical protein
VLGTIRATSPEGSDAEIGDSFGLGREVRGRGQPAEAVLRSLPVVFPFDPDNHRWLQVLPGGPAALVEDVFL